MKILTGEEQYLNLCQRAVDEGVWIENKRTEKKCLTVIGETFKYDCRKNEFPLITTRKSFWKAAVAEVLGYLVGYDNAADFKRIGSPTWFSNANDNKAWLANPNRKGENDIGRAYGVQGRGFKVAPTEKEYTLLKEYLDNGEKEKFYELHSKLESNKLDQLNKVVNNLKNRIDDRGETITFWNPTEFDQACLRPCMHTHTFSVLGDYIYLTSYQRSIDIPLGLNFNQNQVAFLLYLMAHITGLKPAIARHDLINCHIYEDQISLMKDVQLKRKPFGVPTFHFKKKISSLEELESIVNSSDFKVDDYFEVRDYEHHDPIKYPFSE
jgi:thymidylate synthase